MTRRDYELIARVIRDLPEAKNIQVRHGDWPEGTPMNVWEIVAHEFAQRLAAENPRFDRARFLAACKVSP